MRLQPLPPEADWDEARARARDVFGIKDFESALRTASNIAALAGRVQEKCEAADSAFRGLASLVRQSIARLGVPDAEIESAPRMRTARAVEALLAGITGKNATSALLHLARAKLDTSAPAMGRSLASSAEVARVLGDAKWALFEGLYDLDDDRIDESRRLLDRICKALTSDEYVTPLAAHLDEAQTRAVRLLARRKTKPNLPDNRAAGPVGGQTGASATQDRTDPPRPVPPAADPVVQPGSWVPIKNGQTAVTQENWQAEIDRLSSLLKGGRRLVLTWTLEEESS